MRSALQILNDARIRFLTLIDDVFCITTKKSMPHRCSHCSSTKKSSGDCGANKRGEYEMTVLSSSSNAKYCASFDVNQHYSAQRAYKCPGHRLSNQNGSKYSNPNINNIISALQLKLLYANIKEEITTRLNHIFYYDLSCS